MTVLDTRGPARVKRLSIVMLIVAIVVLLLLVWSILGDLTFISSAGHPLLPGEVFDQLRMADSQTAPITTSG
jgi:hypothetical protein